MELKRNTDYASVNQLGHLVLLHGMHLLTPLNNYYQQEIHLVRKTWITISLQVTVQAVMVVGGGGTVAVMPH